MIKSIRSALLALACCAIPLASWALASQKDAQDIVEKAAAYAASHGKDQLIAEVNKKDGPFVSGDLYVFVFNEKGITIAHPVNPALIGKDNVNEPDADGKLFRKEIVQVAETKGSGWVNYKFKNPANGNIEPKISYVKKQGDVIIIAGVYLK